MLQFYARGAVERMGLMRPMGIMSLPNGQLQTANCQPPTLSPHFKPLGHDGLDSEPFGLEFSVADGM